MRCYLSTRRGKPLSLDSLLSPALSLPPEREILEFGYSREGDFHWNEASQRSLPRRTVHRYVYASSKLAQSGECAYEIYSRLCNVGNAPPATLHPSAPPSLRIPFVSPSSRSFVGSFEFLIYVPLSRHIRCVY